MDDELGFQQWLENYTGKSTHDAQLIVRNAGSQRREYWRARYERWLNGYHQTPNEHRNAEFARWIKATYGRIAMISDFKDKRLWYEFSKQAKGDDVNTRDKALYDWLTQERHMTADHANGIISDGGGRLRFWHRQFTKWLEDVANPKFSATFDADKASDTLTELEAAWPSRTRTGRIQKNYTVGWPGIEKFVREYGLNADLLKGVQVKLHTTAELERDKADALKRITDRNPISVHDSTVYEIGDAAHAAIENTMEGHSPMSMTRQQLLDMQQAAARQLADAEAELKKYELFPTQETVLAVGDVIRFNVTRKSREPRPVKYVPADRLQRAQYGDASFPADEITLSTVNVDVEKHYNYVALYVSDADTWYVTGVRCRERYAWDDLVKFMVDAKVTEIEVLTKTSTFYTTEAGEPETTEQPAEPTPAAMDVADEKPAGRPVKNRPQA